MSRNVEIKARLENAEAARSLIATFADQGPFELTQDDTFFNCPDGRLKLRTGAAPEGGELIFYQRTDSQGPKESFYLRSRTTDPDTLRTALSLAYGQAGRVQKRRTLFLVGRTRVHLDLVQDLGNFLELEVVLEDGESVESGVVEANQLVARLGIAQSSLVERAYVDLLRDTATFDSAPTDAQVRICLQVLRAIESDRAHLTQLPPEERRELLTLAGLIAKPDRHDVTRMLKAYRRAKREASKEHDRQVLATAGLRVQRRASVYSPLKLERPKPEDAQTPRFNRERACYICKQPIARMHRYYDSMCEPCGDFNYAKREQTADLRGRYALVTGARVKIGFQASLKLLRAGAHVMVTTRFPVDAAERYSLEEDFADFAERLQIHGLDLRHTPSVEIFTRFLNDRLPRLDYILNNACQTVRRPAGFFQHLLVREAQPLAALPAKWRGLLTGHDALRQALEGSPHPRHSGALVAAVTRVQGEGLTHSAALSQRRYLDEDFQDGEALFPSHQYDEDRQQVDLREVNSWRLRMHEVETPELLEVQLVNAIAPYILNAKLKPVMQRTAGRHKHIVNVSAMEGQFYRSTKTVMHPHTNMAKAALNMMTRTSAPDFEKDGIHMNAVDTGWVTDEDPAVHAARKAELGFSPPLDIIDGAARIVDPVFAGQLSGIHLWGQFLKDYKPAPW